MFRFSFLDGRCDLSDQIIFISIGAGRGARTSPSTRLYDNVFGVGLSDGVKNMLYRHVGASPVPYAPRVRTHLL